MLLVAAGVPAQDVVKIFTGQYTPWDDQTTALDRMCPGQGVAAKAFLEPAYAYPLHRLAARQAVHIGQIARAFFVPSGPLDQSYAVRFISGSDLYEAGDRIMWLDERLETGQKTGELPDAFPWGPAEEELRRTDRHEFQAYAGQITQRVRMRLWESFGNTLRLLWMFRNGSLTNPHIVSAEAVRDLWLIPGALPVGFLDRTFVFVNVV